MINYTKKYSIEIEAEKILNALKEERKPIVNALKDFEEIITKRKNNNLIQNLLTLVAYLTKISKRKTLKNKYNGYTIGLNCNGLGYVGDWGFQLNDLCEKRYPEIEKLQDILIDDNLNLEISQEIVSNNRTNFMKLINKIKKIPILEKDYIKNMEVGKKIIVIFHKDIPEFMIDNEEINYKLINVSDFCKLDLKIKDLINAKILMENVDEIVAILKKAGRQVEDRITQESELNKFVADMLNVYQAMENI